MEISDLSSGMALVFTDFRILSGAAAPVVFCSRFLRCRFWISLYCFYLYFWNAFSAYVPVPLLLARPEICDFSTLPPRTVLISVVNSDSMRLSAFKFSLVRADYSFSFLVSSSSRRAPSLARWASIMLSPFDVAGAAELLSATKFCFRFPRIGLAGAAGAFLAALLPWTELPRDWFYCWFLYLIKVLSGFDEICLIA